MKKTIKKSEIKAMVNEAVEMCLNQFTNINEGDSYQDVPEIEEGINALEKIDPKSFANWVAKNNATPQQQAEIIYNKFFSKVDKKVIAAQAGKNVRLNKVLRNLGGMMLAMIFGMYCAGQMPTK